MKRFLTIISDIDEFIKNETITMDEPLRAQMNDVKIMQPPKFTIATTKPTISIQRVNRTKTNFFPKIKFIVFCFYFSQNRVTFVHIVEQP